MIKQGLKSEDNVGSRSDGE